MGYVAALVGWLAIGALAGVIEARHGHWHRGWVVSMILGPFAVPLALQRRHEAPFAPTVLAEAQAARGPVDLLIGFDGSADAMAAAERATDLFGPRVRRVTLATVLDVDTAAPHADSSIYQEPWPEERSARDRLENAVSTLRGRRAERIGSVILAGEPADALERYAVEEGYEVVVVGRRGTGLSKLLLGSCASRLSGRTKVPVLLVPASPAPSVRRAATESASSATG
jgi:nucleotide-binding universal stress UspA family protein